MLNPVFSLVSEAEHDLLLNKFNNTEVKFDRETMVHRLFEKQVARIPDAIAVIFQNEKLTYNQLNEKANQLARLLQKKGVGPEKIVALLLDRSLEMMIALFAVMKAGGAFLPISPQFPVNRIKHILHESKAVMLLSQEKHLSKSNTEILTINLDDEDIYKGTITNLDILNIPSDLAYVIFTSGSTGNPKGVMIEHQSLINRLNWMQKQYPIGPGDTILQKTPYHFDVSIWELFWWSMTGARLSFLNPGFEKYPQAICETVAKDKVTVMHFVPSMLNAFLNYMKGSDELDSFTSLRQVFCSGEALLVSHVKLFYKVLSPVKQVKLTNLYGPTEATVDVSYFDCPLQDDYEKIPIGKPIDNTYFYVLHDEKLLSVGETGELYISGVCLARGYINQQQLTEQKFVENPFLPGERMYKSGDIVRWHDDGNLEYMGRIDNQVKIRGIRIELEEIESVLLKHESVNNCIVASKKETKTIINLIAFLELKAPVSRNVLIAYLQNEIPDYMIPNKFIFLEEIPIKTNGKKDRNLLVEKYDLLPKDNH